MFDLFVSKRKKQSIHESVANTGNPVIEVLYDICNGMADSMMDHTRMTGRTPDTRYRDIIRELFEFGLYIYYNDTAWMDVGDYALLQMYQPENAEKILTYLEQYQPDIKNCYYNAWERKKGMTLDMEKKGVLQRGQLCGDEHLLVNQTVQNKISKHAKENKL